MPIRSAASPRPRWRQLITTCGAVGAIAFIAGRVSAPRTGDRPAFATPPAARSAENPSGSAPPAPTPPTASTPSAWDDQAWRAQRDHVASPRDLRDPAARLEQLATTDPQRALGIAKAERNALIRQTLLQAALRGWARSAPVDAAHYALSLLAPADREAALGAVFAGAVAGGAATAVQAARQLIATDPDEEPGLGDHLIDALCSAGDFQTAATFATTGSDGARDAWIGGAYSRWASYQPQAAAAAAAGLSDPALRARALHGVVGGWSETDPASAVQYTTTLPDQAEKPSMVSQALERWARLDPVAASAWINTHEGGAEMDEGIASVATMEALKPDVAAGWAESIVDPKLRSETLVSVLRHWATVDLAAANRYFAADQDLLPDDRAEISGLIATLSTPNPGP